MATILLFNYMRNIVVIFYELQFLQNLILPYKHNKTLFSLLHEVNLQWAVVVIYIT